LRHWTGSLYQATPTVLEAFLEELLTLEASSKKLPDDGRFISAKIIKLCLQDPVGNTTIDLFSFN